MYKKALYHSMDDNRHIHGCLWWPIMASCSHWGIWHISPSDPLRTAAKTWKSGLHWSHFQALNKQQTEVKQVIQILLTEKGSVITTIAEIPIALLLTHYLTALKDVLTHRPKFNFSRVCFALSISRLFFEMILFQT